MSASSLTPLFNPAAEWDYERARLPVAHKAGLFYARKFRAESVQVRVRGLPGDQMRANKLLWFARNNEASAAHLAVYARRFGLTLGVAVVAVCPVVVQGDLFFPASPVSP